VLENEVVRNTKLSTVAARSRTMISSTAILSACSRKGTKDAVRIDCRLAKETTVCNGALASRSTLQLARKLQTALVSQCYAVHNVLLSLWKNPVSKAHNPSRVSRYETLPLSLCTSSKLQELAVRS